MPQVSDTDLAALRDQKGQFSKFYLGVLVPHTVHSSQINNATIARGARTIAFDGGSYGTGYGAGYPNTIGIVAGMTLWVGTSADSHDICKLRIRSFTSGDGGITGNFTVCEHAFEVEDDHYLTVKEEFKLWPKHATAVPSGILVTCYKDYDIAYSGQNRNSQREPIVRMGPPGAAIRDATTGQATVNFWSDSGAAPGGNAPSSYAWRWRKETGNWDTAATAGTAAVPHSETWNGPGNFLARLTLDGTTHGYRPVFIFDPTGTASAYEDFEVQNLDGDFEAGGWRMGVRVKEDCAEADFPEESMVILFAEDWYKGSKVSIGGNYAHRENVIFTGFITKESVRKDPFTNDVLFEAHTIDGEMRNCEKFPHSYEDHPNANNNWLQIQDMTMDKVAYHIMRWESTLLDITDVHFSGDTKGVRWSDIAQKGLYEQLDDDCYGPILGRMLSDRTSLIRCELNPQFFDTNAERNALATIMNIETQDWRDQIELPSPHTPVCSLVDLSAGSYAGSLADVELIFSLAHGDVPIERGKTRMLDNLIGESQIQCNRVAGNYLANQNNPYPRVSVPTINNYRVFDIAPQEWVMVPIAAGDTYRGVEWTTDRFLPRIVRFNINNAQGALNVDLELEKETTGTAGIAGYYPTEPPDDDYIPPPTPTPPPIPPQPPGEDSWEGIWIVGAWGHGAGSQPGILRTEDLGGATAAAPTWSGWNTGIDMGTYKYCRGLGRDPWNPKNRLYCLMSSVAPTGGGGSFEAGHVIYRREYSGGAWGNWTVVLNEAIIEATIGYAITAGTGWISRFSGNINAQGHLYCIVSVGRAGAPWGFPQYFFKSTDYGDTWTATVQFFTTHSGTQIVPICVRAGMLQGTSGYGAGQVLYASWRNNSAFHYPGFSRSLDQGTTWTFCDGGTNANTKGRYMMVDPNDQSILYVVEGPDLDVAGQAWKYTNHGSAGAQVATWGNLTRAVVRKSGTPNTQVAAAQTVIKTSYDDGATVNSIAVDGNIAGAGLILNWDWNLLMAGHSFINGINGTRYFQLSPDGGTTWFNKHGNMAGDFYGIINVGFSLDN